MLPSVVPKGNPPTWLPARVVGLITRVQRRLHKRASPPAPAIPLQHASLAQLARPDAQVPAFVAESAVVRKYLDLLGPLDWDHFPERPLDHPWPGTAPAPRAPYVAAYLIKLNEGKRYMSDLRSYLLEHPALVWLIGFPLVPDPHAQYGFDVAASLPDRRQLGRVLRELPNPAAQFLLGGTVHLIRQELPRDVDFGDIVSLDTKHILAWVQENNPKAYIEQRYDKTRQPTGDPDCKLGCKKRHNQGEGNAPDDEAHAPMPTPAAPAAPASPPAPHATPTSYPQPASQKASLGEFYWGYASGVVTTKVPQWGEIVLAELTQTFDKGETTYFFPLMVQVERRLGHRPRFGALDKAYDAFYVYQYFHEAGGFAAVPLVAKGRPDVRTFSPQGLPTCAAGQPMPLKLTFTDRTTTIVVHERGKYVCPLRFPQAGAEAVCPVNHANWPKGGCTAMMPTCPGARIRYQLDRDTAEYKAVYQQRTADERINAQAKELGIERPYLRRQSAIVNQNTLIYVLINLRALQRVRTHKAELARQRRLPSATIA
jgi:hypothetical protein